MPNALTRRHKQTYTRFLLMSSVLLLFIGFFFTIHLFVPSSYPPNSPAPVSAGTSYFQRHDGVASSNDPGGIESHSLRDWSLLWEQPIPNVLAGCEPLGISHGSLFCYDYAQPYRLYALNPHNGMLLKHQDLSTFNVSHAPITYNPQFLPLLVDSIIYVGVEYTLSNNDFEQLYALHASDLTLAWTSKLDGSFFQEANVSNGLTRSVLNFSVSGGRLFVLTDGGHVAAFNALSGSPIFQADLSTNFNRTNNAYLLSGEREAIALSALGNQFVYVSTAASIVSLNATNGALVWQVQRKRGGSINLSTTSTGLYTWDFVPFTSTNPQNRMVLDALAPATGKLLWSWTPPSSRPSSPASFSVPEMVPSPLVGADQLYTVVGTTIYALHTKDARLAWRYDIGSSYPHANYDTTWDLTLGPPVLTSGLLLFSTWYASHPTGIHVCFFFNCPSAPPNTLQALNPFTGHVYWRQFYS